MNKLRPILTAATALAFVGCYGSFDDRAANTAPEPATLTVAELRMLCNGTSEEITSDAVIAGRVTTSDEAGNFSRSFFVEDTTGGAEIMAWRSRTERCKSGLNRSRTRSVRSNIS